MSEGMFGVDTSHWQKGCDWKKVRSAGYAFAFLKASEGQTYVDAFHDKDAASARDAGMLVGHYHYANGTDPVKEADHLIKTAKALKGEPLILDYEIDGPKDMVGWCLAFLDRVLEKTGSMPMLYTGNKEILKADWSRVSSKGYLLWVSRYGLNDGKMHDDFPPAVGSFGQFSIWQYTSAATVPGINGRADANWSRLTVKEIAEYVARETITNENNDMSVPIGSEMKKAADALGVRVGDNLNESESEKIGKAVNEMIEELDKAIEDVKKAEQLLSECESRPERIVETIVEKEIEKRVPDVSKMSTVELIQETLKRIIGITKQS